MKITALASLQNNPEMQWSQPTQKAPPSFALWLGEHFNETNQQLHAADKALQQLASGEANSLHQTMLSLEQAKLSLQFLTQVRNRLLTAWQDILREQI